MKFLHRPRFYTKRLFVGRAKGHIAKFLDISEGRRRGEFLKGFVKREEMKERKMFLRGREVVFAMKGVVKRRIFKKRDVDFFDSMEFLVLYDEAFEGLWVVKGD